MGSLRRSFARLLVGRRGISCNVLGDRWIRGVIDYEYETWIL